MKKLNIYPKHIYLFVFIYLCCLSLQAQELTENNASDWGTFSTDQAATSTSDNTTFVEQGTYSVGFHTAGAFATGLYYPLNADANWDLTGKFLQFSFYGENNSPYGFQAPVKVRLYTSNDYFEYTHDSQPPAFEWVSHEIEITGSSSQNWTLNTIGSPSLTNINKVEFVFDTWDAGFDLYLDAVEFVDCPNVIEEGELTENNALCWGTFASDMAAASTSDNTTFVEQGMYSVEFNTLSGFATGLYYPIDANANWDLTGKSLLFSFYAENFWTNGFQAPVKVRLYTGNDYFQYTHNTNPPAFEWVNHEIAINGSSYQDWTLSTVGSPSITNINKVEFIFDTWDAGFDLYLDAVQFVEDCTDGQIIASPQHPQYFIDINSGTNTILNLDEFFDSCPADFQGTSSNYNVIKRSPGVNPTISGNQLSVSPTSHFLGITYLELQKTCDQTTYIDTIVINTQMTPAIAQDCNTQIVNFGVYNFDPIMPQYNNQLCHQAYNWNDPITLTEGYIHENVEASGNYTYYNLTHWEWIDDWPIKSNNFKYDPDTYDDCWVGGNCYSPDIMDYPANISNYNIDDKINSKLFEEVWFWGGPAFGYYESAMAGPGAFYINGGTYTNVDTDRPFVVMGFNYERRVTEMMHSNGHRAENHMRRAYGYTWNQANPVTNWDKYTSNRGRTNSTVFGVGDIHFPANGDSDYDYADPTYVTSTALDWANYPNLTGATTSINRSAWAVPDYSFGYMKFWFNQLPKADGINADGRMNNWWKYIYDYTGYDTNGESINTPFIILEEIEDVLLPENFGTYFITNIDCRIINADVASPQIRIVALDEGVDVQLIGNSLYAHSQENFEGLVNCILYICDGDYSGSISFTITVGDSCINNITLTTNTGSETIIAGSNIISTATIQSNGTVIYDAPQIILDSGFSTPTDTDFEAIIYGCGPD